MFKKIKYYFLRKMNPLRCRWIYSKQKINNCNIGIGCLTIFHDYEGKYAFKHVEHSSIKGLNYILDVEKEFKIKATYNIVGKLIIDYPELANRIVSEGHDLASHSYDHKIMMDMSCEQIRSDILETKKLFESIGVNLSGFRSPQGRWTFKQMRLYLEKGLKWTAERDFSRRPYRLMYNKNNCLIRLPVVMDDWEYISKNISPDKMYMKLCKKADEIAETKTFGGIGFHPWVQGSDEGRLLVFRRFIESISKRKDLRIVTFDKMHELALKEYGNLKV